MGRDVVNPHDVGAERGRKGMGRKGSVEPVCRPGLAIVQAAEQRFAGDADQDGKTQGPDLGEPPKHFQVLVQVLPKPTPGSRRCRIRDAGPMGDVERALEEEQQVGDDIEIRVDGLAVVHDDHGGAVRGCHGGDVGLALESPDVVHDARAGFERDTRGGRLVGIDRDRHGQAGSHRPDHRKDACLLILGRDRNMPGPGRFAADIEDRRAFGDKPLGLGHGRGLAGRTGRRPRRNRA